jgi:TonB family protein
MYIKPAFSLFGYLRIFQINQIMKSLKLIFLKVYYKLFAVAILVVFFLNFSCSLKKSTSTLKAPDTIKTTVATVDTEYYSQVEKPAVFEGGFNNYLKKNIKYPLSALKKKQQGLVVIQYGIDCYGSTKIFSILKSSGSTLLDNEAQRAINSSPKWMPAKIGTKSVGQLSLAQIRFKAATKTIEVN